MRKLLLLVATTVLALSVVSCSKKKEPDYFWDSNNKFIVTVSSTVSNVDWALEGSSYQNDKPFLNNSGKIQLYAHMKSFSEGIVDTSSAKWSVIPEQAGTFSIDTGSTTVFNAASSGKYDAAIKVICRGLERIFRAYIGYEIDSLFLNSENPSVIILGNANALSVTATAKSDGIIYSPQTQNVEWSIDSPIASLSQTTGRTIYLTGTSAGTAVLTASLQTTNGIITSTASIQVKDKIHLFNDDNLPENWYVSTSNKPSLTLMSDGNGAPSDSVKYLAVEFASNTSGLISYKFSSAVDVKGYKKLCFWAKSSVANSKYSFKMHSGGNETITLTSEWQFFELQLNSGVSSLINVFEVSPWFTRGILFLDNIYLS